MDVLNVSVVEFDFVQKGAVGLMKRQNVQEIQTFTIVIKVNHRGTASKILEPIVFISPRHQVPLIVNVNRKRKVIRDMNAGNVRV